MTTQISNSFLTAEIKHLGAELFSLKNNSNKEYIWNGNPDFWGKHSPILFPIVGTLKNDTYQYNGIKYKMSRHGFARDMKFELLSKSENSAIFSLIASEETKKMYPFDFELQIGYRLKKNQLIVSYKVINNTKDIMPFSIGAHPAFALNERFQSYSLVFEYEEKLNSHPLENDLISDSIIPIETKENLLPLNYSLFEKDALIFKKTKSKKISILENNIPLLEVEFKKFPSLGLWTKTQAPFICIEPWIGYSDTIHSTGNIIEKEGVELLQSNAVFECNYKINIAL